MVLTKFNQVTLPKQRSNADLLPRISLSKSGTIHINKAAAKLLELSDGAKLGFAQTVTGVWLVGKDNDGFLVKRKDTVGTLHFSHKDLTKEINISFELDSTITNSLLVLEEPKTIEKSTWFELTIQS